MTVGFVSNNSHEFWTVVRKGVESAGKEFKLKVEFRMPTGGVADQHRIIEDLKSKGVQAIAVSAQDAPNQVDYYKKLNTKLPVLAVDNDIPDSEARRCFIGVDNVAAGRAAGKLIKRAHPEGGQIMIFVGKLDNQNAQERRHGVVTELAGGEVHCKDALEKLKTGDYPVKFGKFVLLDTRTDDASIAVCENALVKFPGLNCIVGLWAYNPPAILTALKAKGKIGSVTLVGFDEDEETLNGVRDGSVAGTVVQDPYQMGYEAVRMMAGLVRDDDKALRRLGMTENKQLFIPCRIVTKDGKPSPSLAGELMEPAELFITRLKKLKAP